MKGKDFFTTRRTVRNYSGRPIGDEMLTEMLEAASHAPTTGNMQLYSVIVTRDESMKKALAPWHFNQPSVMSADVVLTFCADFNRFVKWCECRDAKPGYDNFQSFMTAVLDTTILAQQFVTIAEANGLGCCYLGTTTYNAPQIAETLGLPDRVVPVTTLTVALPRIYAGCKRPHPRGSLYTQRALSRLHPLAHRQHICRKRSPRGLRALYSRKQQGNSRAGVYRRPLSKSQ